jgi:hypothetical protein
MKDGTVIVPSPEGTRWAEMESVPLELARSTQGRLFEKHILSKGTLIHPVTGERIVVDDAFVSTLRRNFEGNVCDIVQVPLANSDNKHDETPRVNLGEVVGLRERDGKVYAVVDAREDADKFGKTYLGASAFLSTNYTDSRTGKKAGPTLLHVAVTNRPYVVGLEPYKEIVAATAGDDNTDVIVMTQEETVPPTPPAAPLTLDELKAMLSNDHGIDLDALQAAAAAPPPAPEPITAPVDLTAALTAALAANPTLNLSQTADDQLTSDDLVGAVVELSRQNVTLANGYEELRRERATEVVDTLVGSGHILPKQREFAINLKLTRPQDFTEFVPDQPVVDMGKQSGVTVPRDEHEQAQQEEEVTRLTAAYTTYFEPSSSNGHRH